MAVPPATMPGAIIGALVVRYAPRRLFDISMAVLLALAAVLLLIRPQGVVPGSRAMEPPDISFIGLERRICTE